MEFGSARDASAAKAQVRQILSKDKEPAYLKPEQVTELERIAAHAVKRFS